jgi:hypothetical protein
MVIEIKKSESKSESKSIFRMKAIQFLKYFFWGTLGLFLQTHGWNFSADFFVLTLAFAFPVLGLGPVLFLALTLSFFFGAHSLTHWAMWWLPTALSLGLLRLWKPYHSWPGWPQRATTVILILIGQWLWVAAWGGGFSGVFWGLVESGAATLAVGLGLIPLLLSAWKFFLERLPRPRPRMDELPLYWHKMKSPRPPSRRRRPFGLERL